MPGVSKIMHKGKEILLVDYKGAKNDQEMISILTEAQRVVIEDNKEYLQLIDISDVPTTHNYMQRAKKVAKETPKLATKRAIVGIKSPSKKVLLMAYNLIIGTDVIKQFATLEEAKDWLVEKV